MCLYNFAVKVFSLKLLRELFFVRFVYFTQCTKLHFQLSYHGCFLYSFKNVNRYKSKNKIICFKFEPNTMLFLRYSML